MMERLKGILLTIFLVLVFVVPTNAATPKLSSTSKTIHISKSFNLALQNYSSGTLKWSRSNTKVATITKVSNAKYKVTGKNEGNVTIKCVLNGKTYSCKVTVKSHSYGTPVITKKPTCTSAGEKTATCSCGAKKITAIDPTGHIYGEEKITVYPTCTEKGLKVAVCMKCKNEKKTEILPTGHKCGEEFYKVSPTCTEDGVKAIACTKCGDEKCSTIPASGHSFGEEYVEKEATCTDPGSVICICKNCGFRSEKEIPATGHHYVTNKLGPTCTKDGKTEEKCTICQEVIHTAVIPATGHSMVNHICTVCNYKDPQAKLEEQLNIIGKLYVGEKWKYYNNGNSTSYTTARTKKTSNCSTYVSYALQAAGTLRSGQVFYSSSTGKLSASDSVKTRLQNAGYKIITYSIGKSFDNANLQPGDIVLWKAHTNVYIGKNSSGTPTWYDGGKNMTDTKKEGGTYIKYKRTGKTGFTSDNKIYGVIRYIR